MSLLRVEGLSYTYPPDEGGARFALKDVSLSLERGELLGVLGPNGGGKSTLLRLLSRALRAESGGVLLDGRSLEEYPQKHLARRVAMVPQEISTVFALTVEQMIALGRFPHSRWLGGPSERDRAVVDEALARTDLLHLRDRLTPSLSGGERRRVLLARALAQEADVLLLDEPTAHLDPKHQADFVQLVEKLRRERDLAVIAVLHDVSLAAAWCPRLLLLKAGAPVAQGSTAEVLTDKNFEAAYGIPAHVRFMSKEGGASMNFLHR